MIHTKSLIRRLAYVPWLLAFGLVLGWAGETQAQLADGIRLSVDKTEVREDGGAVTIKVTAKTYVGGEHEAFGDGERVVLLRAEGLIYVQNPSGDLQVFNIGGRDAVEARGRRFTVVLSSIVIPKDSKEESVDVIFTPIPTNHENDETVTTGENPYKANDRFPNDDLIITLWGNAGPTKVDRDLSNTTCLRFHAAFEMPSPFAVDD